MYADCCRRYNGRGGLKKTAKQCAGWYPYFSDTKLQRILERSLKRIQKDRTILPQKRTPNCVKGAVREVVEEESRKEVRCRLMKLVQAHACAPPSPTRQEVHAGGGETEAETV